MIFNNLFKIVIILFIFFNCGNTRAQIKIQGIVKDSLNNETISNICVYLVSKKTKNILTFTFTDKNGNFKLSYNKNGSYELVINSIDYFKKEIPIEINNFVNIIDRIFFLIKKTNLLNDIILKSNSNIEIRGDTIGIKILNYVRGDEHTVEDVLKKLPGINVNKDGKITINNKEIQLVMVEGDDFFENNYKLLTQNMQGNVIDKIEIIHKYSKNNLLKEIEESDKVAINIKLKNKYKFVTFGNTNLSYDIILKDKYDFNLTLQSYSKKNKFFINSNLNTISKSNLIDINSIIHSNTDLENEGINLDIHNNSLASIVPKNINIGASRSFFNNDKLISINFIFNPTNKLKIKPTIFLNNKNKMFSNLTNTKFTNINEDFNFIETNNQNFLNNDFLSKIEIEYKLNSNKNLNYIALYSNSSNENTNFLLFNNNKNQEKIINNNSYFKSNFIYTQKISKKEVFLISQTFLTDNKPDLYSNSQFNFFDLYNLNADNFKQVSFNMVNHFGIEVNYKYRKDAFNYTDLKFGFNYLNQFINNKIDFLNKDSILLIPFDLKNEFIFKSKDIFMIANKIISLNKKLNFESKLNFSYFENNYIKNFENNFLYNIQLGLNYNLIKKTNIELFIQFNKQNSDIHNFIKNYYLFNFRTLKKGVDNFKFLQKNVIVFEFNHEYLLYNYINFQFVYSKDFNYLSNNIQINANFNKIEKIVFDNQFLYFSNFIISHFFKNIKSKLLFNVFYSKTNYNDIVNSIIRNIHSNNLKINVEFRSSFIKTFDYHIGFISSFNEFQVNSKIRNYTQNIFLDIDFLMFKKINFQLKNEFFYFENLQVKNSTFLFTDLNTNYTFKNNKIKLGINIRNLFNINDITFYNLNDISITNTKYILQPRIILFELYYKF